MALDLRSQHVTVDVGELVCLVDTRLECADDAQANVQPGVLEDGVRQRRDVVDPSHGVAVEQVREALAVERQEIHCRRTRRRPGVLGIRSSDALIEIRDAVAVAVGKVVQVRHIERPRKVDGARHAHRVLPEPSAVFAFFEQQFDRCRLFGESPRFHRQHMFHLLDRPLGGDRVNHVRVADHVHDCGTSHFGYADAHRPAARPAEAPHRCRDGQRLAVAGQLAGALQVEPVAVCGSRGSPEQ